ncbi:hypothetical protein TG4357_03694 [Thalassovita gelatinovora]|uniref:UDP-2,3-diacylglucosamine pyrophosphatase LpxI n=1 Tax=Thalassovita gelatinovora TaxID=53501 RepID=A0A0N7LWB2_THAGE|nr:UDP-2,3-diacylglucosamine diphosphatase LpxI [Thalassovita gelatinovora]QIZ79032.1 LpxI family protein [Thalassovita gelatinovora]CUH68610.1 hypothetical protein TG4357_03694 [Thalassovita gelatinovora]SEQ55453.1 hypothetical protein SAMN04488043_106155 [Thalassovita gelatinovora]
MTGRLAILAGNGVLPVEIATAHPEAVKVVFDGVPHQLSGDLQPHAFEKLGGLFEDLRGLGVTRVVMAGSMTRPPLDAPAFDPLMISLAPRLLSAMQGGDDALFGLIIEIIEEQGFEVLGAHDLVAGLTAKEGLLAGPVPTADLLADADRGADILNALAPVDIGQGCVVAGGLCLGVETIQGTDFMLRMVAETPDALRRGASGVFIKASKRGQDLRVDMPAIGPDTVVQVQKAGLAGIVVEAGHVMILERDKTLQEIEKAGLFLMGRVL